MKKVLSKMGIYALVGLIITVPSLALLDKFIYSMGQTSLISSNEKENAEGENTFKLADAEAEIQYSYDNKYYTFLKDNKIHIYDSIKNEEIKVVEEEEPICYSHLLYDKNLIMYFTEEETYYGSSLTLKTYEIDTERTSEYNTINVNNFSRVKDMSMSPIINIIYVNIETKSSLYTNNLIYRIDLFNSISNIKSGTIINNMIMLQQRDRIYYEDEDSNIYMGSMRLSIFGEKVNMIGIDLEDNLYFISKNDKDVVYKVKNNYIVDEIELTDTDLVTTYTNYEGVYLVYPNYIMEVSGEDPYRRIGRVSKYFTFEAIKDQTIYLKTSDNLVVRQNKIAY